MDKVYGSLLFKDSKVGSFTYFKYNPKTQEGKIESQNALGNPTGFFDISNVNFWNDLEGPSMRDVSTPYFASPITKGDVTLGLTMNFTPEVHDYEAIVGKNLGVLRAGVGTNYHVDKGKGSFHGLFHANKSANIKGVGKVGADVTYNTRDSHAKDQINYGRQF
ncbi:hypothetical protein COU56_05145 [Candidatus Pacearchaeota archaeon CG10_big_fil_rev_8_21_14_0_10_31_9]|nr:MAG: hypothetical protein COU56_05145 [Candidatus Pacearchaeota archaeon CG10_big_fil_rev_8_21_14_0_10_31_9]